VSVALAGQAVGLLVLGLVLLVHGADAHALAPGALAGACGAIAILAFYRALALGTMSVVAPIVATSAIVPVLAGVLDGERPELLQWAGMAAALTGVALASMEPGGRSLDSRRALQLALLAALMIGLSLVFLDRAADHDALTGVGAMRVVAVPLLALVVLHTRARAPLRALPRLGVIGLLDTGANTAFALATTGGLLSLVAVLGGLFPVVTVALAYVLLHERLQPVQRAGVALALAGIPLISA
jgi:drug/metabolite transporter (DMT)-like permease